MSTTPVEPKPAYRNPLRRLYDWTLSWADSPYGTVALGAISFIESSFFPIPPDVLQIALSTARPKWSYFYATVNMVCSVLGGVAGWFIGMWLWMTVSSFFFSYVPGFTQAHFSYVQKLYEGNAFIAIVAAAFTPIPFKVFTIGAGVFGISLPTLILASLVGRGGRFYLVATLMFFCGARVKLILEKYLEIATVVLFAMVLAGFFAIKMLAH